MKGISSLDELREKADGFIKNWGPNYFYGIRIHGTFEKYMLEAKSTEKALCPAG